MQDFTQDSQSQTPYGSAPDFVPTTSDIVTNMNPALIGADNHNIGNTGGGSWFDPNTWNTKFENAGKFIAVSLLSGANSLYDSAVTVSNWFGADAKVSDTQEWISSLDSDLGQYYSDNRRSADLAGFIATSFLPGMGGVKILNAGQSALRAGKFAGVLGENMSKFTGILAPSTETYVKLAASEIKAQQTVFTTLNANAVKALGAGVVQHTLEAAAFETAVQATMFKSPVLEDQDKWDVAKNILTGGILGGVVGGGLEAARTLSAIKKARVAEDFALKPFTSREVVQEATSPADRIILAAENRDSTATPILTLTGDAAEDAIRKQQYANAVTAVQKKSAQVDLDMRTQLHAMNGGASTELVNAMANTMVGQDVTQAIQRLHGAVEVLSPMKVSKLEKAATDSMEEGFQSRWIDIGGENLGRTSYQMPSVVSLADRVSGTSGSIADAVKSAVRDQKFDVKKLWDPLASTGKLSWREAEARHIWADSMLKELPDNLTVHENDIPLLERALKDGRTDVKVVSSDAGISKPITFVDQDELKQFIIGQKNDLANSILEARVKKLKNAADTDTNTAAISKIINVKQSWLEGTRNAVSQDADMFAWQDLSKQLHQIKANAGEVNAAAPVVPSYLQPSLVKVNYRLGDNPLMADGHVTDALTFIKSRQKLLAQDAQRVAAKQAGDLSARFVPINSEKLAGANSYGAGPGMFSNASSKYGSLESDTQYLGGVSKDLRAMKRQGVDDSMQRPLYALANNQKAAIEWDTINQQLSRTSEQYVFDDMNHMGMGTDVLIPKRYRDAFNAAGEDGDVNLPKLQEGAAEYIKPDNWETLGVLRAHQELGAQWTSNASERFSVLGKNNQFDPDVVRPIRPNPKDYPHFAFVVDPRVTGAGHAQMLFGNTEKELQDLVTKTNREFPEFKVLTKQDTAEWHLAHQTYEYPRGLNENYIDSSLNAKGIYSNFYTRSDPQTIANSILQHHYRSADLEAAEVMRLRYNDTFNWLEDQAQQFSQFETSKFSGGKLETIAQNEKNPYLSYIKTALNLQSTPTSNPWWSINKFLDNQVSKAVGRIRQTWDGVQSPQDLDAVNKIMNQYGSNTAFNSASEVALVNHTAPKAELSKFVRGANAIMSRFTLGLDPLNSLNNAIGANVLRGTELNQFTKAISAGNKELAGELSGLMQVTVPGTSDQILSPTKLIANSIARFWQDDGSLMAQYKANGFIRGRLEQFKSMADDLTLRGQETVQGLNGKLQSAFQKAKDLADKGEKWSGNTFAEEFNRFISADVMKQITDLGEKHGLLTPQESLTYINNFVNRVEGNTIATQRPGLFQGPLGQAIGLFQSYQFNLLQQMFRYVAEGDKKDLGMLLGLQGTFYGLQGEPGFKFLNDHIVGTASGNPQHRDMYDAVRGTVGKQAAEWMLYGTASNLLQTNIYSRGDINPRQLSVVPTNIADVPFVGGLTKTFSAIKDTASKIQAGGNVWEAIRQGIEHGSIYRPLAGLAQVSRAIDNGGTVFSTSSKGSILGSNDLMSLASLSRLAGGRPLDEAIMNDTMFSVNSYEAADRAKKQALAETIKTSMIGNSNNPDPDQVTEFAKQYAYLGGKQTSFAKYMMEQYTQANTQQSQILARKLNNPLSYKVQELMGGEGY